MRFVLVVALVLAPMFFGLGVVLPLVRFETLYFFDRSPSLLGVVEALWTGEDAVLAVVVALVSLVFPVIKMLAITAEALGGGARPVLVQAVLPQLSRWSLMDVVLVALVIVAAKTGGIAEAFSQPGLWFYAGSALMAALAHGLAGRHGLQSQAAMQETTGPARDTR
ncbi:paraquat-inducible protein A [uncultured Hoeflea sp.]|uniref:paraquat-inducible protein A n=1 Tax=uncultured Hoeflea sp. TaxID=538666 RepID=UPI0026135C1F|nr:paraquat-inducible protein A [uncultured Hoeflea sp.]